MRHLLKLMHRLGYENMEDLVDIYTLHIDSYSTIHSKDSLADLNDPNQRNSFNTE